MKKLLEDTIMVTPKKFLRESTGKGVWVAPVWKLDRLNLNGRVYPTKLAQRIVAENKVTGVCDGHEPDYHQEYRNFVAVAKNPSIRDGEMWVEIEMLDEDYARHLEACMAHGLPIGVSSVGYGECDADGVVDAETYELIRYMDFVTCPAGEVYATKKERNDRKEDGADSSMEEQEQEGVPSEVEKKIEQYKKIESIRRRLS